MKTLAEKSQGMTDFITRIFSDNLTALPVVKSTFLTLISLILRSEENHEATFVILKNYKQIQPISSPYACEVLQEANKFLNNIFTSNDILGAAFKAYKLFNVSEKETSKDILNNQMTEESINELYKEFSKYISGDVYLLKRQAFA